jgi:hypothetical protein
VLGSALNNNDISSAQNSLSDYFSNLSVGTMVDTSV